MERKHFTTDARNVFKEELTEDTGGGTPFEKGDSNTRTTGENGEYRQNHNPDTMQPRDEEGHFAEKALVGKKRLYEHPKHDYVGSNFLKRLHNKLSDEAVYAQNSRSVAGEFANLDKHDFANLLYNSFATDTMKGQDKRHAEFKTDFGSVIGNFNAPAEYMQMRINGSVGHWSYSTAESELESFAEHRIGLAAKRIAKGKDPVRLKGKAQARAFEKFKSESQTPDSNYDESDY